jgi:ABC-type Fe3+ transport system permease subunit
MPTIAAAVICFFGGFFALNVALSDWEEAQKNYRAVLVVKAFGRKGARAFYMILGVILVALGVGALLAT